MPKNVPPAVDPDTGLTAAITGMPVTEAVSALSAEPMAAGGWVTSGPQAHKHKDSAAVTTDEKRDMGCSLIFRSSRPESALSTPRRGKTEKQNRRQQYATF